VIVRHATKVLAGGIDVDVEDLGNICRSGGISRIDPRQNTLHFWPEQWTLDLPRGSWPLPRRGQ
jgi:hypothetical protein